MNWDHVPEPEIRQVLAADSTGLDPDDVCIALVLTEFAAEDDAENVEMTPRTREARAAALRAALVEWDAARPVENVAEHLRAFWRE